MIQSIMRNDRIVDDIKTLKDSFRVISVWFHMRIIHKLNASQCRCQDTYTGAISTIKDSFFLNETFEYHIKPASFHCFSQYENIAAPHPDDTKFAQFFLQFILTTKIIPQVNQLYIEP